MRLSTKIAHAVVDRDLLLEGTEAQLLQAKVLDLGVDQVGELVEELLRHDGGVGVHAGLRADAGHDVANVVLGQGSTGRVEL
jgi:hypothetical protein